jgi:osmotically-inducible protein OsmY
VVTLFGIVPTPSARAAAELEVVKTKGVHRVENRLEVVPASQQEATETHDRALEDVLRQGLAARPELAAAGLDVAVRNGVARLRGRVASAREHHSAVETVRGTDGVRDVFDQLEVEGPGEQAASS